MRSTRSVLSDQPGFTALAEATRTIERRVVMLWLAHGTLLVVLAVSLFAYATVFGVGVSPDSTQYLDAARGLSVGRGLTAHWWSGAPERLTHYPPLYPALLAALASLGPSIDAAAWWLNGGLLVANAMLVGAMASAVAGGSLAAATLAALAVLLSRDVLITHTMAWSEPCFFFCALVSLWSLARAMRTGSARALAISAVFAAAAALARYVGVVVIGTGVFALCFLEPRRPLRSRLFRSLAFGVVSAAPLAGWLIRNAWLGGDAVNRELAVHPVTLAVMRGGASTLIRWIVPAAVPPALLAVWTALTMGGALIAFGVVERSARRAPMAWDVAAMGSFCAELPRVLALFVVAYVAFLLVSISFVDAQTTLGPRFLVPVFLVLLVIAAWGVATVFRRASPSARGAVAALVALYLALQVPSAGTWLAGAHRDGLGYNASSWRASPLVASVAALPAGSIVYSNRPDALFYLIGQPAVGLPRIASPNSLRTDAEFDAQMRAVCRIGRSRQTFVAYFHRELPELWFVASEDMVRARLGASPVAVHRDGTLYRLSTTCAG